MRFVKFIRGKKTGWGIVNRETIRLLQEPPFRRVRLSGRTLRFDGVRLLAPAEPGKVILVGLNYRRHARELGMAIPREPVIFLKPATALCGHGDAIVYPRGVARLDYEAELALVIRKEGRRIPEEKAGQHILGYTCLNDVTARDLQKTDIQWTRAKSFDTFCPLGPWVATGIAPGALRVRSYLNGLLKQDGSSADFIFSVRQLVAFISRVMTLKPGDVISTGTPAGVGPLAPFDVVEVDIEGVGRLTNRVVREA